MENKRNLVYSKNLLIFIILIGVIGLIISIVSFFNSSLLSSLSLYFPYVSLIGSIAFSFVILFLILFIIKKENNNNNKYLNNSKILMIISIILNIIGDLGILVLNRNIYGQLTSLSFLAHLTFFNEISSLAFYFSIFFVILYYLKK